MYLTNISYVRHLKYAKVNLNAYNLKSFDTQNRQATCLFFYMVLGYSFQLAITAPRIFLIGYGTATAQS